MEDKDPKQPVQYATPVKRLWAWVGVVYMLILLGLNTYALTTGRYLAGIGSLGVAPALLGLGGTAILRYRGGESRGGLLPCLLIAGGSFLLAILNLIHGLPILLSQL